VSDPRKSWWDDILAELDERGGFPTSKLSRFAFGGDGRQRGANAHYALVQMERDGLVRRLDEMKPVCWCRTPKGTASLRV